MTAASGPGPAPAFPASWSLELDRGLRRLDSDRVLIGGYPLRVLRLSAAGAEAVGRWSQGEPVGPSPAAGRLARRLVDAGAAHPVPVRGAGRRTRWALVVPTRGHPDGLAALLASALEPGFADPGTLRVPDSVVVVDDGSPDPPAVAMVAGRYGATLLRHEHSRGPAAARNTGWRATPAGAEVVAFLDDDCRCPQGPEWVEPLLDHLADPTVALAAPRVRARRAAAPAWLAAYEQAGSPLDLGSFAAAIRPGSPVAYVPAAALVVRRAALEDLSGFDESLRVGEDVDFEWRLVEAGWALRYEPGTAVAHDVRPALGPWARQRVRYGASAVALDERHPGAVAPVRCSPWSATAWGLAATTTPAGVGLAAAVAAGSTAALVPRLDPIPAPARHAVALAGRGHWWAGGALARAARREWWPLLALGLLARRGRRIGAVVAVTVAARARRRPPPGIGRLGYAALAIADDLAYGTGVWSEAIRRRRFGALLPRFANGPQRVASGEEG